MKLVAIVGVVLFSTVVNAASTNYCDEYAQANRYVGKGQKVSDLHSDDVITNTKIFQLARAKRDKKGRVVEVSSDGVHGWESFKIEYDSSGNCIPVAKKEVAAAVQDGEYSKDETDQIKWDLMTCKKLSNMESELRQAVAKCEKMNAKLEAIYQESPMMADMWRGGSTTEMSKNSLQGGTADALVALDRCQQDKTVAKMLKDPVVGAHLYSQSKIKATEAKKAAKAEATK